MSDKVIEFIKWFSTSVVIVILTMVINYSLQDREQGLNEVSEYNKYFTELIIANKDIGKRRLLAQFFAYATPSEKLRKPWMDYYLVVEKEYQELKMEDSVIQLKMRTGDTIKDKTLIERHLELKTKLSDDVENVGDNTQKALDLERQGFENILSNNINEAINNFKDCDNTYPQFHSAYEIKNFLIKNKSSDLKTICKGVLQYTWKMPDDIKQRLNNVVNGK